MSSVPSIVPSIDPTKPADGGSMSARERACSLAEAHLGALFGVQRFELVDVRRTIDWLGRERFVVDADVGFAHARGRSLVDPKRARVLEVSHYAHPVPYGELPMITAAEALESARTEVGRLGWTWFGRVEAELQRPWFGKPWWLVLTNADMIGCNARIGIDAKTRAVIGRGFLPR